MSAPKGNGWDRPTVEQIIYSLRLAGEPEAAGQVAALLVDVEATDAWRTKATALEAQRDSYAADLAAIRQVFTHGAAALGLPLDERDQHRRAET